MFLGENQMEKYQEIISRIELGLRKLEVNISKPLNETGNEYRQIAEAICKAIIVGSGGQPIGLLDKLISDAYKFIEEKENSQDASIFKTEIRYLQGIGNTFSHDGSPGVVASNEDQITAFSALTKVIRVAFFGSSELDAPLLPEAMSLRIPDRTIGLKMYENPRAEDVVKLCFPKNSVSIAVKKSDHASRLVYDYLVADLGGGVKKGYLFIRSRTALEKSFADLYTALKKLYPDSLDVVTPRAYRVDGVEIDRKKSVIEILKGSPLGGALERIAVSYFDEFVWDSCVPAMVKEAAGDHRKTSHFIEQILERLDDNLQCVSTVKASAYIESVLSNSQSFKPVQVIIGPAGIGKSTFCDAMVGVIGKLQRKHVVLLSSTDFRDLDNVPSIESVADLYRVAVERGLIEESELIEAHNFEINLACGNFVLFIDGFDELESHLGASLKFEQFMNSLVDLEACFRKVSVILTVRDHDIERFRKFKQGSICRLRGFSNEDTQHYLKLRLDAGDLVEAKQLLTTFVETNDVYRDTTIPLYASLICDYFSSSSVKGKFALPRLSEDARFFVSGRPLDKLVNKIVDREIAKQSLGSISADDFFEVLVEIIRAPQRTVTKANLRDLVEACGEGAGSINAENFERNPFLHWSGENAVFRYDSLSPFFKSRLLSRRIKEGVFSESPTIDFLSEMYQGEGALYDELMDILPVEEFGSTDPVALWVQQLLRYLEKIGGGGVTEKKAMSGFLYWRTSRAVDKNERSNVLIQLFGGRQWRHLSIYGKFHPMNLLDVEVRCGHIENFGGLSSCDFLSGKPVFFDTEIVFDEKTIPSKLDQSIFGEGCTFSGNLRFAFEAQATANELGIDLVKENLYKIAKVGFRSNRFHWKSKDVYKKVTVLGKYSLDDYLQLSVKAGLLILESSRLGDEPGYVVADSWYEDARKLVEEKNLTGKFEDLVADLMK